MKKLKPRDALFTLYQVLFTANIFNLASCQHFCVVPGTPQKAETMAATSTVTDDPHPDIEAMLLHAPRLFENTGFSLINLPNGCSGSPLVEFNREVIPLLAEHCLEPLGNIKSIEARVSVFHTDPMWHEGYHFPTSTTAVTITLAKIKRNKDLDVAYVRGLFPNGLPPRRLPLKLARMSPRRGEVVMGLEKRTWVWEGEENGIKTLRRLELLSPVFGLSYGRNQEGQPNEFLFAAFGGDSNSPIINARGEVVGIVWGFYKYKRERIRTYAYQTEAIWKFLESTWDD